MVCAQSGVSATDKTAAIANAAGNEILSFNRGIISSPPVFVLAF